MPRKPLTLVSALVLSLGALASAGPAPKAPAGQAKAAAASAPAAGPAAQAPANGTTPAAPGEATESTVVYLGKTGSRYHLKGCRYLKGAGKEITVGEAFKKGYAPCNVCKAPRLKRS